MDIDKGWDRKRMGNGQQTDSKRIDTGQIKDAHRPLSTLHISFTYPLAILLRSDPLFILSRFSALTPFSPWLYNILHSFKVKF